MKEFRGRNGWGGTDKKGRKEQGKGKKKGNKGKKDGKFKYFIKRKVRKRRVRIFRNIKWKGGWGLVWVAII